ncbi:MAG: CoB--CoM heterodisulfide reductase subunit B [Candidatus Altiarchaeales archaeon]|nr:MAG: CoB--CoM heterodisulfide reductase subunit B [Candidatus Altiarchaeales archaeon]
MKMGKHKFAYYAGCTSAIRIPSYDLSTRNVLNALDIELEDITSLGCCGMYEEQINEMAHLTLAARIMAIAEDLGLDILVICNGCFLSLKKAKLRLADDGLKAKVNEILADFDLEYKGESEVKHYVQFLYEDYGLEKIKEKIAKPLSLRVAAHYGCHLLKPSEVTGFDDFEEPQSLDKLIEVTGATSIDYMEKKLCCGGYLLGFDSEKTYEMAAIKLRSVKNARADLLVTICPFCNLVYDHNQRLIEAKFNEKFSIPVLHYPQLLGIALGLDFKALGIDQNRVRVNPEIFNSDL